MYVCMYEKVVILFGQQQNKKKKQNNKKRIKNIKGLLAAFLFCTSVSYMKDSTDDDDDDGLRKMCKPIFIL